MLSQAYSVIIDRGVSEPGYRREVVDGINATENIFLFQLMETVQLWGSKIYDTQMVINSPTSTDDISLDLELPKHLYNRSHKHGVIDKR